MRERGACGVGGVAVDVVGGTLRRRRRYWCIILWLRKVKTGGLATTL